MKTDLFGSESIQTLEFAMDTNLVSHLDRQLDQWGSNPTGRILTVLTLALLAHLLVKLVQFISDWLIRKSAAKHFPVGFVTQQPKFITLTGLLASALAFTIYFFAIGWILSEQFDVRLGAYLASASVIGLAVGFGSQGLVQDVVTSLTFIFSDTLDVGDLIEVSGQVGRVRKVGLRFTELSNLFNQQVFVPNRMIANIGRFPLGGIYAYADVQLPPDADREQVIAVVKRIATGTWAQFGGIILGRPEFSELDLRAVGGWTSLRVQFKLWPGQGPLIEFNFRQQIVSTLKAFNPNYADWMVPVTYRAEGTIPKD